MTVPGKIQGIALISVLVAVAVLANIVLLIAYDQEVSVSRTAHILQKEQAIMYGMGMEQWVKIFLTQDLVENNYDSKTDFWYNKQAVFPVDGGVLSGYLEPLQAKYNINNAALIWLNREHSGNLSDDQKQLMQWEEQYLTRVLQQFSVDADSISAILDWLDADDNSRGNGTESLYYQNKNLPYRAANSLVASLDELKVIKGFDQGDLQDFTRLEKALMVLPVRVPVNINLADTNLLQALHPDMTGELVKQLIVIREQQSDQAFVDLEHFYQALKQAEQHSGGANLNQEYQSTAQEQVLSWQKRIPAEHLTVTNDFFALYTKLMFGEVEYKMRTVIQRVSQGDVRVIQRELKP